MRIYISHTFDYSARDYVLTLNFLALKNLQTTFVYSIICKQCILYSTQCNPVSLASFARPIGFTQLTEIILNEWISAHTINWWRSWPNVNIPRHDLDLSGGRLIWLLIIHRDPAMEMDYIRLKLSNTVNSPIKWWLIRPLRVQLFYQLIVWFEEPFKGANCV